MEMRVLCQHMFSCHVINFVSILPCVKWKHRVCNSQDKDPKHLLINYGITLISSTCLWEAYIHFDFCPDSDTFVSTAESMLCFRLLLHTYAWCVTNKCTHHCHLEVPLHIICPHHCSHQTYCQKWLFPLVEFEMTTQYYMDIYTRTMCSLT